MKKTISFICGMIIGSIVGGIAIYYFLNDSYNKRYEEIESTLHEFFLPDYAKIEINDTIIAGEPSNLSVVIIKNGEKMYSYTGTIRIKISDINGSQLKKSDYTTMYDGRYSFQPDDLGYKEFEKGLTINTEGTYYIEIEALNEYEDKLLGKFPIIVLKNNNLEHNNQGQAHSTIIEIDDSDGIITPEFDEYNNLYVKNYDNDENLKILRKDTIDIQPDSAEISVKNPITMGEPTNFKIKILKNELKFTAYNGTIGIVITKENGENLKNNEYSVPNHGLYTFQQPDLGEKEFQKGLTINKEGNFFIEVLDLSDFEDKVLGKIPITVVKNS